MEVLSDSISIEVAKFNKFGVSLKNIIPFDTPRISQVMSNSSITAIKQSEILKLAK